MAPIESLSNEVRQMADSQQYKSLAGEITDDEIGELAKTCDQALKRFHEALSRENSLPRILVTNCVPRLQLFRQRRNSCNFIRSQKNKLSK